MNIQLEEDSILEIQLLMFDKPKEGSERFSFLEMSTLQVTTLLLPNTKINSVTLFSSAPDDKYIDDQTIKSFTTVGEFNTFFLNNKIYYIDDCTLELENGLIVDSHDDGEVSIEFVINNGDHSIIETLFKKYNLNNSLIKTLKSKPGYYISIDTQSNIIAEYETFDEYVEKGRK